MKEKDLIGQLDKMRRKVDFDTYDILVQQLITMVESGSIDVAPAYQRQFRWDKKKRSQLIESILLGVPVPSLFMATNRDGTWELVDGVQRLSTLVQFAGTPQARSKLDLSDILVLSDLEKLSYFNGKRYGDLPGSLQLQFSHRPLKVITLSDKSDLLVRFDLFERLNTGGVALSNQEIRSCIYRGRFAAFLRESACFSPFVNVVKLTRKQEGDGTREECVLRFFAFLHGYKNFVHSVVGFLNDYMSNGTKTFDYDAGQDIFQSTFEQLYSTLPNGIVRSRTRKITPINLYEAVSVGAALAIQDQGKIDTSGLPDWLSNDDLMRVTTGATNNRRMVESRIEYCRDQFLGA